MTRRVIVQDATAEDLESIQYWNGLAGVVETSADFVKDVIAAKQRGALGAAVADKSLSLLDRVRILLQEVPRDDWYWACTIVLSLRFDGMQVGMIHAGAHHRLWKFLGEAYYGSALHNTIDPAEFERREAGYLLSILTIAKLHMVAVSPDQRSRGHGRRLVNHAVNRFTQVGTTLVYGQFGGDRDLRDFYQSLGYDVLGRGESLNMAAATGIPGFGLQAQPDDTFFARAEVSPS